ncbi:type III glutamate--ammonia ligase [Methyloceanibacter caenitepidi]|uniref:Glutamine synthetase type I n=1 Tax=Methyloceanibacter caenitepidi TaxID=1384459 RepID=A0A0A8JZM0_9HYPH|nr:type III glutamate--ammonia ligase [Methyloceanibacter caenitepidi]BAQ16258.1 glutamine synthetase type I [Methyloceanibacter caenitepidi]
MSSTPTEFETLHRQLSNKGVEYMMASFSDMHGVSKTKMVPLSHLEQMMAGSELYTGAALDGVPQDVSDEEVSARPDPASCIILPWQPDVAWFASNLWCEGKPFEACSRNILARATKAAADMGLVMNLGMEAEFYVLKQTENGATTVSERDTLDKPCYDGYGVLDNLHWLSELVNAMDDLGWDVYSFDHEDGNGQFEIDFSFADAMTMADRFVFLRMMANAIARKHGYFASWMPKPFANRTGSGAHYNMSLASLETGENLFKDADDPRGCGLSKLGYQFVAGVLRHLPAISAVVSPTVNSYKRLIKQGSMSGSTWAPVFVCYGNNNRTNALRIPLGGGRVELRAADSANNPYLGAAMVLSAGLEGIREGLDPGDPHTENMYNKSPSELQELGIALLPRTLEEAIDAFEADPFSRTVLGEDMFKAYAAFRREEWDAYHNHISDWERDRYLKFF